MDFVHLHLHTEYSLLDGCCRIGELVSAVKKRGQKAVAITDHGVMYGAVDFYKAAKKEGIKPIIGCEVYVAPDSRFNKNKNNQKKYHHLVLLCKNAVGYQNLIKIVSLGFTDGFYSKPRIDKELLEKYHEGLVCLSACIAGEIPSLILSGDYDKAKETALWFSNIFGKDDYYLELQDHSISEQITVNSGLLSIHNETGIPLVATNDVHYIEKEDSFAHKVLLCIQTGKKLSDDDVMEFKTEEFYLKESYEMEALFEKFPNALENTVKIAEKCNFDFEFGNIKIPKIDIGVPDHFAFLRDESYKGLKRIYGENIPDEAKERVDYELSVINKMGYVDYYLIVRDFVTYAKNNDIPVGLGRGSGAGSLVAYCLSITGINPLKYGLLFERFLNPERVSMPDFDIDFCYIKRQSVIDYVTRKYGNDRVAQIVTFGTMAARNAIRDVGRVTDVPYNVCDKIAKLIPMHMTLDTALSSVNELKTLYDNDSAVKELVNMARKLEGMPRHASTHAAGVVISDKPISEYVPLSKNDEAVVTEYTMTALDELGLLKIDFLGLRNLTVIDDTVKEIKIKEPDFDIEKISLSDKETLKMMGDGFTEGVFQFESAGMKNVLRSFKPETVEDLIAILSLYRPGPMDSIPKYIHNRFHPEDVSYPTPLLKPILDITYGCIVYQEQVMQIFRTLAGYSLGRADIVRRAMSKKKHDVMQKERDVFLYGDKKEDGSYTVLGAVNNGIDKKTAEKIFDDMAAFSSYAFNKSHAAAYGVLAYRTAYLKCKHPKEYMSALLTSVLDNKQKVSEYTLECQRLSIKILPPDINESVSRFTACSEGIRFGLSAIKNLGEGLIANLINERTINGNYTSMYDFCLRNRSRDFNRRALEGLIKSGAFDNIQFSRRQALLGIDTVLSASESESRYVSGGQMGLFSEAEENSEVILEPLAEMSEKEKLCMEKEVTGLYLSGHPLSEYNGYAQFIKSAKVSDIEEGIYEDGAQIFFVALISEIKTRQLKNGNLLCSFNAEDISMGIPVTCFSATYEKYRTLLTEGNILKLNGKVSSREDKETEIILSSLETLPEYAYGFKPVKNSIKEGLYIRVPHLEDSRITAVKKIILENKGNIPVYLFSVKENKKYSHPTSVNNDAYEKIAEIMGNNNVKIVEKS